MLQIVPGTIIDERYQVVSRLGSGGMADVYCAEDLQLGRRVAVKLLHERFAQDEEFFRLGFQAALHARTRCREFDQVSAEMNSALEDVQRQHPGEPVEAPFIRGYQRGREHYQRLCGDKKAA